ncbi:zinc finger protein ZAT5-like protein [Corchorus capsularis]|uniref:Zinc finger protein ZAT5-like protein n=1 Tax=Corchorus capsularis TaxID=210143 RepID=A0A1R3KEA9_COCAP|nr:zinc finger protein ZAT5-like protein [Corchorus capsularis]
MEAPEEVAMGNNNSKDYNNIVKGKRTKRLRPQSPIPFAIASNNSIYNGDNGAESSWKQLLTEMVARPDIMFTSAKLVTEPSLLSKPLAVIGLVIRSPRPPPLVVQLPLLMRRLDNSSRPPQPQQQQEQEEEIYQMKKKDNSSRPTTFLPFLFN